MTSDKNLDDQVADADELLIRLLALWEQWTPERDWYLRKFIPAVIADPLSAARTEHERGLLLELRDALDSEEWSALGLLAAQAFRRYEEQVLELRQERVQKRKTALAAWPRQVEDQFREADRARANEETQRAQAAQAKLEAERQIERALRATQDRVAKELAERKNTLKSDIETAMERDFLTARAWWVSNDSTGLLTQPEYDSLAAGFAASWCEHNLTTSNGDPWIPDEEQAHAIASVDGHALVAARAGSGKTATMVARSAFLVRACGVDPSSILMLAFNNSAAAEMEDRLEKMLPGGRVPHVMTFHALAYRLVHPAEKLLRDESDTMRAHSRYVQDVIGVMLRDPKSQSQIRDVMLAYFSRDWSRIVDRGDHLSARDQVEFRRHLQDESLKGDFVKSFGEKRIANLMFSNGIAGNGKDGEPSYAYELDVRWNGQSYKPDFTVFDGERKRRIVIEYFGLLGDPSYDEQSDQKREFWSGRDVTFLEYLPSDVARPDFTARFLGDLRSAGAPLRALDDDELWRRIGERAIDRFTETSTTMIGRARQRRWQGEDLLKAGREHTRFDQDLARFTDLAAQVLDAYERSLASRQQEDFSGLLWRAVDHVLAGRTAFGRGGRDEGDVRALRYIVVDEFQDFSLMFFELVKAILSVSPDARVMAVGDDWQAINEFAGSTTDYFTGFESDFHGSRRLAITTNRRSTANLVSLGNRVMAGFGQPAASWRHEEGSVREFHADAFDPSPTEQAVFGAYDRSTPALLRLIQSHRVAGRKVAVISRRRRGKYTVTVDGNVATFADFASYGEHLRKLLDIRDPKALRFSSTHQFKGKEEDAVILVDVTSKNYPLIHPTWPLFQLFGDTPESLVEAERRLFYVGVSRPFRFLDVITTKETPSTFWSEARSAATVETPRWDAVPEVLLGSAKDVCETRVFNRGVLLFEQSKAELATDQFRYRGGASQYWWRHGPSFDPGHLQTAAWAQHPGIRIQVWRRGELIFDYERPGQASSPLF